MYDEGNILSDKKLLNIMEESDIIKISELFSNGEFEDIINNYFKKANINNNSNNKDKYDNFSKSNNNLNKVNKKGNISSDSNIIRTLTFNEGSGSLADFEFIFNSPPSNDNDILKDDYNFSNPYSKKLSSNITDNCFNSSNEEEEFDYTLLEKCDNDKLTQQILLTIVIYCLIKAKEDNEIKSLLVKFNIPDGKLLFPLILLKAKFYFKNNTFPMVNYYFL